MIVVDKRMCNRLYQWDVNQRLIVDGTPDGTLFDFVQGSNVLTLKPYSKDGHTYVNIPNIMLQTAANIVVYQYLVDGEEGHTETKDTLFIHAREKPSDYIYTETEIYTIEEAIQDAIAKAKADGSFRGEDGKDGLTPYIGENKNWWIGENDTGIKAEGIDGKNGKDGADGLDGVDGIDGLTPYVGENGNWWIGEVDTGTMASGKDGKDGENGKDGKDGYTPQKGVDYFDGKDGVDGKDGYTPQKGVDYFDGKDGADGKDGTNGIDGKDGADGHTPVKGEDYFTEAEKADMVKEVQDEAVGDLEASLDGIIATQQEFMLPTWNGGSY